MPELPRASAKLRVEDPDGQLNEVEIFPHLERAPITEALLDVRVRARKDLRGSDLDAASLSLRDEYPVAEDRSLQSIVTMIARDPQVTGTRELGVREYYYRSNDRLDVVQFRVDGLALNRFKPYQSWKQWFPRFERLWSLYTRLIRPESVTRIAVRCINLIDLPPPPVDLTNFLTAPPPVPRGLADGIGGFVTKILLRERAEPVRWLNLTQSMQGGAEGGTQIRIDVEAFITGEFAPDRIIPLFEPLHVLRNRAFFRSITARTIALHQ